MPNQLPTDYADQVENLVPHLEASGFCDLMIVDACINLRRDNLRTCLGIMREDAGGLSEDEWHCFHCWLEELNPEDYATHTDAELVRLWIEA